MTSNRPLRPGDASSRAQAWRRWLLHSLPGRILLAGAAVKVVSAMAGALVPSAEAVIDVVDAAGSLMLLFVGGYLLAKGAIWARRRLLWRVRRKLILSYVFVGLVPGLLIITLFLLAGFLLFFNISSYLLQSRVQALLDQARSVAQSAVLEAEYGEADAMRRRLAQRISTTAQSFPYASLAIVPVYDVECPGVAERSSPVRRPMQVGHWQHLPAPDGLPRWIQCDGFAGLFAYEVEDGGQRRERLVLRAVALPETRTPRWAVVVDLPFSLAVEERVRTETDIRVGEVTVLQIEDSRVDVPRGTLLEPRPPNLSSERSALEQGWVTLLDVYDWDTGTEGAATIAMQVNLGEVYQRISTLSTGMPLGELLLLALAFIGVLFLTIQSVALIIGVMLARQITGAVHDLFVGTEHLRNRDFSHQIPVRARDQLGELAESFNTMTSEISSLIRENAAKARMEQEMLAAREIQQRLLPSGPLKVPGLAITAFCEPAREVAGDYFDFLRISDTMLGVLIADVSGKGLPAGLYMAQLKVLVQSLARTHTSPREFLKAVNRVVADNIDSKSFITMSYGVVDLQERRMVYARAGHCPLIRVPGSAPAGLRRSELLTPDGLVLGLQIDDGTMFDAMIQEVTVPLEPDDLLVFFTDGISEAMNEAFECYGEPRLAHMLEQYAHLPFEQLRAFIFADLRAFTGQTEQHDDMTMILLKVEDAAKTARM